MKRKINVKNIEIVLVERNKLDYISLTDIARYKNADDPRFVIQNWMKTRYTVDFLGFWEQIHNENFNRVEFDTVKNEAGTNAFVLTPQKWIEKTKAIGVISKAGRYGGGTYAHKDIAFEFASWISAEFKLYLIKEFQRLKEEESERLSLGWDLKRNLAKINYKIHTDAIKENLIPLKINKRQENMIYANEADVLNVALFGMTAKDWRDKNPGKEGNVRDYSSVEQLVCLSNLESMNAILIKQGMAQKQRLQTLNEIAIDQMKTLLGQSNGSIKRLK
ncbi:MAG: DNA-binding protein [Candidatus Moranbacteria bacterium RIFOXYA12_FULL_44_15]|nr:MAG: DNA-binding protein [Candidatus Moranbacteria bacterium RIFOXYA12_FULL_44_15]